MREEDRDRIADGLIGGILFAVVLLCYIFSCLGCASTTPCPPCIPETEVVTVVAPVLACPPPPSFPTLTIPEWPTVPSSATADSTKAFYADVAATIRARERILRERLLILELALDTYSAVDVVP